MSVEAKAFGTVSKTVCTQYSPSSLCYGSLSLPSPATPGMPLSPKSAFVLKPPTCPSPQIKPNLPTPYAHLACLSC